MNSTRACARIRARMAADGIDLLWLMAPESLYYVSGYKCIWYQAQSPKQWPATSGIAIHRDRDDFILFDTPSEAVMCRFVTCARDIRIFPMGERRDGIGFIVDELKASGWLVAARLGMEFHSYRPNPVISERFRDAFDASGMAGHRRQRRPARGALGQVAAAELAQLENAAEITDIGLEAAKNAIRPGRHRTRRLRRDELRDGARPAARTRPSPCRCNSGVKANCGHARASRKRSRAGEQVNIDVSGVFRPLPRQRRRARFTSANRPQDVLDYHRLSSDVFDVIDGILRPGLTVGELVRATRAYYDEVGIWSDAAWVGGYELGLAFPPDWVGNFVYEMSDTDSDRAFEPGTSVNFESQFFGPRMSGITYYIDTLLFKQEQALLPIQAPRQLVVIE